MYTKRTESERYMKEKEGKDATNRITTDLEDSNEQTDAGPPQHKSRPHRQEHYAWCNAHIRTKNTNFDDWEQMEMDGYHPSCEWPISEITYAAKKF